MILQVEILMFLQEIFTNPWPLKSITDVELNERMNQQVLFVHSPSKCFHFGKKVPIVVNRFKMRPKLNHLHIFTRKKVFQPFLVFFESVIMLVQALRIITYELIICIIILNQIIYNEMYILFKIGAIFIQNRLFFYSWSRVHIQFILNGLWLSYSIA